MEISRVLCHQIIGSRTRPVILIDWSDMDEYKQHFVLRAAMALEGRCLTLYEEVHTIKTKEKLYTHEQFLGRLEAILPDRCRPILVTDAGFRTTWFKLVKALGWDWVGRVRNRHYMRWISGGRWFDAKQCYQWASSRPKYLGEGVLTIRNKIDCQFVIYKGKLKGRNTRIDWVRLQPMPTAAKKRSHNVNPGCLQHRCLRHPDWLRKPSIYIAKGCR